MKRCEGQRWYMKEWTASSSLLGQAETDRPCPATTGVAALAPALSGSSGSGRGSVYVCKSMYV